MWNKWLGNVLVLLQLMLTMYYIVCYNCECEWEGVDTPAPATRRIDTAAPGRFSQPRPATAITRADTDTQTHSLPPARAHTTAVHATRPLFLYIINITAIQSILLAFPTVQAIVGSIYQSISSTSPWPFHLYLSCFLHSHSLFDP